MFKFFLEPHVKIGVKNAFSHCATLFFLTSGFLLFACVHGCMTAPPLSKADLSAPGWTVRQGQAVWHPRPGAPEIAGELLVATRTDGSVFVQFTKTPFPFAIAQSSAAGWQIEFPPQNERYAGHGTPPARIVWFQLADALTSKPLAKGWKWQNTGTNWQLQNPSSGESLEGYLSE